MDRQQMSSVSSVERAEINSEVWKALRACRPAFVGVAVFSAVINILSLTGSIFMLQVYDRVIPSRSGATLVGLSLIALAAYLFQGALDAFRARMLARIGAKFDELLAARVFDTLTTFSLFGVRTGVTTQGIRDLDQVRSFLSGAGPTALFDFPWMPLFFVACFLLHPWIGVLTFVGGLALVSLTVLTELRVRNPSKSATMSGAARHTIVEMAMRNAETLKAMGMDRTLGERFAMANARYVDDGLSATDVSSTIGSAAKVFRAILQSAVLALGAYLAISNEMSAGGMIAAMILTSRALAPIEVAVAHWKSFVAARQGFERLEKTLKLVGSRDEQLSLPRPRAKLVVSDLSVGAPGQARPIIQNISFELSAGQGLGVIGPSASGKSTLARALIGVWSPSRGSVRLDGASLDQWDSSALGSHIGYLPQDIELFDGTVAENIARFGRDASPENVIKAARAADAHEMILQLPQGYNTKVGNAGAALSGGQRQRIGLARALYGDPFLVVLDEPNSNLDSEGEEALVRALHAVREWGGVVVLVTHRPTALAGVDQVAMMANGQIAAIGRRDEVLKAVLRPRGVPSVRAATAAG
jgi:ATP-binding cassette, subfamily C, bacterial PrsD